MTQTSTIQEDITASTQANSGLRSLALKADRLTGADIERLVREARQSARRQHRQITWQDLDQAICQDQPVLTREERKLRAVHEAGHAVLHHALAFGDALRLSIEGGMGPGFHLQLDRPMLYEEDYVAIMAIFMAGRAAEELVLDKVSAGSAGLPQSDLGRATAIAMELESTRGFSRYKPMLYREPGTVLDVGDEDSDFAKRVYARLEHAHDLATHGLNLYRELHQVLTAELEQHSILEGQQVAALIARVTIEQHRQGRDEACQDLHSES